MNETRNPVVPFEPHPAGHRVLIASMPKAGTYLVAEILKALGYRWTGMHLFELGYTDYSEATLELARSSPAKLHRELPLNESIDRVDPGSFAVGHLPCSPHVLECTRGFKYLFLQRRLRLCLVSYMRFYRKTKRQFAKSDWLNLEDGRSQTTAFLQSHGEFLVRNRYEPMLGWKSHPDALTVRFEDLTEPGPAAARAVAAIARHLDLPSVDGSRIIDRCLAADTITKLPERTNLEDYWSLESEEWFLRNGGHTLNQRLGYNYRYVA